MKIVSGKKTYKKEAICIAKQLGYERTVIEKLEKAKNDAQIGLIMRSAREKLYER